MKTATKALFDHVNLENELDRSAVVTLATLFKQDTAPIMANLPQAVRQKNAELVRSQVHMLRGGCRSISALRVDEFCEVLEDAAAAKDWCSIEVGVFGLGALYDRLIDEISEYIRVSH